MFSVPDAPGAKVGVIGSGKGMTEVRARAMRPRCPVFLLQF